MRGTIVFRGGEQKPAAAGNSARWCAIYDVLLLSCLSTYVVLSHL